MTSTGTGESASPMATRPPLIPPYRKVVPSMHEHPGN